MFFMAGWFRGSQLLGFHRNSFDRHSMVKLYAPCVLICKNDPDTVTFYSSDPEDASQEFYLQDVVSRFKECL